MPAENSPVQGLDGTATIVDRPLSSTRPDIMRTNATEPKDLPSDHGAYSGSVDAVAMAMQWVY